MRERYGATLGLAGGRRKRRGAGSGARYVHDETREPGLGHSAPWVADDSHAYPKAIVGYGADKMDRAIPSSPLRSRGPTMCGGWKRSSAGDVVPAHSETVRAGAKMPGRKQRQVSTKAVTRAGYYCSTP